MDFDRGVSSLFCDASEFCRLVVVFGMLKERRDIEREGEPRDIVSYSTRKYRTPYPNVVDGVGKKLGCGVSPSSSVVCSTAREWQKKIVDVGYHNPVRIKALE